MKLPAICIKKLRTKKIEIPVVIFLVVRPVTIEIAKKIIKANQDFKTKVINSVIHRRVLILSDIVRF